MNDLTYRVGIDVGGTFTDFVVADRLGTEFLFHKQPSVPNDPSMAVAQGLEFLIAERGLVAERIELIVHGTTLGLNAVIQQRGARVALVVSLGNRDVMEIARARMPNSYDFTAGREAPLVPREAVFEVSARMLADGSIYRPLDPTEIAKVAREIEAGGYEAVAIMLLNSYKDPTLEHGLRDGLRAHLPVMRITCSHDLWPEMREYERALVTAMNAYIHPLMGQYFDALADRLAKLGITSPLFITANNGGSVGVASARERPLETILSGPASGVLAASRVAVSRPAMLTFDMGGTSTDIAISQSGELEFAHTTMVGDYPLMLPVVNVSAIGAGGGSIVWVDPQGLLKVGPESAGASPGPVAYGRGGTRPTMTDCYLTLGYLDPAGFNDGRMRLDDAAARHALGEAAAQLGLVDAVAVAVAAIRVASAKMATELRKLLAQKGLDPRRFTLVAYGGAGPTHANLLAEEAGLETVLVPKLPGTFCALGAVLADVRRDFTRPARVMIDEAGTGFAVIEALIADAETEAGQWIALEGELIGERRFHLTADIRYPAQAFELSIEIADFAGDRFEVAELISRFHREHERLYGFFEAESPVQVTNLRLAVIGQIPAIDLPRAASLEPPEPAGTRQVFHGQWQEVPVYARAQLGEGALITGPALVDQPDTTVWILDGWQAEVDGLGNLLIKRGA